MANGETIFNDSSVLKEFKVWINEYELLNEDVVSFGIDWKYHNFVVQGNMVFKDSFELSSQGVFDGVTTVKVYAVDMFGKQFMKTFRMNSIRVDEYSGRFKVMNISFMDELYYKLDNTYLSKSFTADPMTAFKEYLEYLGFNDTYWKENKIEIDFDELSNSYSFVVPQDQSAFEFFYNILRNNSLRMYQTRYGFEIKNVDFSKLSVSKIDNDDIIFTNNTSNNEYVFKIHDFALSYNNIFDANRKKPKTKLLAYSFENKNIIDISSNLNDNYSIITLNNKDMSGLQQTDGEKMKINSVVNSNGEKLDTQDIYMNNNTLEIAVVGNFKYTELGTIVKVIIRGNPTMEKTSLESDIVHSGNYFINEINDRFIGNRILQKIQLVRADFQEPRK